MTAEQNRRTRIDQTASWLRALIGDGQVVELRALGVQRGHERPHTVSGFFDHRHLGEMAEIAVNLSEIARGVYYTMNPLRPDILARRANRTDFAEEGKLAKDVDVIARRFLLVDADPVRDAHISSTDSEKAAALDVVQLIRDDLVSEGWPQPVLGDSGNGYHLVFRVDLPADDGGIIHRCLEALAAKYDTSAVHVDQSVHNASRICKLPGTVARKGDSVPDRPHRRSCLIEIPERLEPVPLVLLDGLAARAPSASPPPNPTAAGARNGTTNGTTTGTANGFHHAGDSGTGDYQHRLLVDRWLRDRGVGFRIKPEVDSRGRTVYVLRACPFGSGHGDPDSCIMQSRDGALSAKCFHSSCNGRGWQHFKDAIGKPSPNHFDPPLPSKNRRAKAAAKGAAKAAAKAAEGGDDYLAEAEDDPHRLARVFLRRFQQDDFLTIRYWRQEFFRWDGRAYQTVSDHQIQSEVTQCIRQEFEKIYRAKLSEWKQAGPSASDNDKPPPDVRKVTRGIVADVLQALRGITCLAFTVNQPSWLGTPVPFSATEALVCHNTIVHLPTLLHDDANAIHPLTPRLFSQNSLDYEFNATAKKATAWRAFLELLWPSDPQSVGALQEWFGYCLLPDTKLQKILLLVGPKRSGKGTIARVLSALVGPRNVCNPTLSSLGLPFGLQPLIGKTLAVIADARLSSRTDVAAVTERLLSVSGEDSQSIDRKFRESVTVKLATRFMVLTNELPRLHDSSAALVGRMVLLRLTRSFYGQEDAGLTETLLAELPGILQWSIEGWKRLHQRGHFLQPDSSVSTLQQMEDLSSPMSAFVRERCEVGPCCSVACGVFYEAWKDWADLHGMKPGTEQTVGRDLRASVPGIDVQQPRMGAVRYRVYSGITLRNDHCGAAHRRDTE